MEWHLPESKWPSIQLGVPGAISVHLTDNETDLRLQIADISRDTVLKHTASSDKDITSTALLVLQSGLTLQMTRA